MGEREYSAADNYWPSVFELLDSKNGVGLRHKLWDIKKADRKDFVAIHALINDWIRSYLVRTGLTEEEVGLTFTNEEAATARLSTYLWNMGIKGRPWSPSDLPRILSGLDGEVIRVMSVDHSDWKENNIACIKAFKTLVVNASQSKQGERS